MTISSIAKLGRLRLVATLSLGQALLMPGVAATAGLPALDRPAVRTSAPLRTVLLSAAMAGPRVVAVGERGIVLLSDDLGAHWRQAQQVPVSVSLTAVRFVDALQGWAVGHAGVILHTQDGGEHWMRQADGRGLAQEALNAAQRYVQAEPGSAAAALQLKAAQLLVNDGPDKPLLALDFKDARHGQVVGAYNLFFETSDGGATWRSAMDRLANPKGLHLYAIRSQGNEVYIAGEQGLMLRSRDGGQSFAPLASPYSGSWFSLAALPDGSVVAAGLRGNAFYSPNHGQSWSRIEGGPQASFVSASVLPNGSVLLTDQAGELMTSRAGAPLSRLAAPALPPLSEVLPLPDGRLMALGMGGAATLSAPAALATGAAR